MIQQQNKRPHTCSKSELAMQYMPHVSSSAARRTMRTWIDKNPKFKVALVEAGYSDSAVLLTPAQVQIHWDFLGEP